MKKKSSGDLYGIAVEDIEVARQLIEGILGAELDAHESLYRGGDHYCKELDDGRLVLQPNNDLLWQDGDPVEERWAEPDFIDYPILLYVDGGFDSDRIRRLFITGDPQIRWLRRDRE